MQIIRRAFFAAAAFALVAVPALAGEKAPFTTQSFAAAQKAGKPVLVVIHADWCPTCAKQGPIVQSLVSNPRFGSLLVLEVNFDTQKDAVRALGARAQSTLIAYKGATEAGRSVGETNAAAIEALAAKAL